MAVLLCEVKAAQNPGIGAEDVHFLTTLGAQAPLETWRGKGVPLVVVNQEMRESCDKSAGQLNWKQAKNQATSWCFL